jgi:hypothetical protein
MFLVGQFARWGTLTNSSTSYQITNFTVIGSNEAIIALVNGSALGYSYSAVYDVMIGSNATITTNISGNNLKYVGLDPLVFTDFISFGGAYSNASAMKFNASITYQKSGLTLTTVFSNIEFKNPSQLPIITNSTINLKADLKDATSNLISYINSVGTLSTTTISVSYVNSGLTIIYFGSQTNGPENISGSYSAFAGYGLYNYFHSAFYTGSLDYTGSIGQIEKYGSLKLPVNLTNGN